MNTLFENALWIWVIGAILFTLTGIIYLARRTTASFVAVLVVLALTGAGLLVEYLVETPREAVARTLSEVLVAIEANDLPTTLTYLSPGASEVRSDAETLMPRLKIDRARAVGEVTIDLDDATSPSEATATFKGFMIATDKRSGVKGGYNDRVTVMFAKVGTQWLIRDFAPAENTNWRKEAAQLSR